MMTEERRRRPGAWRSSVSPPSCPTPPTRRRSGRTSRTAATRSARSRRTGGTPPCTTTPTPQAPDKTYSKIGGWVRAFEWDPLGWKLPIPPAGERRHGRHPEVGGQPGPRRAGRLRLARAAARHRAHRGRDRQRHGRGEALPDRAADQLPRVRPRARGVGDVRRRCPRRCARRSSTRPATACGPPSPPSPRTPCPASWPTSSPAGSPTCSTSAGRTTSPTPPAPPGWRPWPARSRGSINREYDAVLTGGIDRNMGAVHLREVLQDRRAVGHRHPPLRATAPTASSWARAGTLFLLKRLADAERDGDRIYAVLLGMAGVERRQGQGHHRPQPDRPAARRRAGLAAGGRGAVDVLARRGARHLDRRRRRGRGRGADRRVRRPTACPSARSRWAR